MIFDTVRVRPRGYLRAHALRAIGGVQLVIIDVDGTLTDGSLVVGKDGHKQHKVFGPDDSDALHELQTRVRVELVTADTQGFDIVKQRAHHMGLNVTPLNGTTRHVHLMTFHVPHAQIVYVGDGYYDWMSMKACGFGIAPHDAWPETKRIADAVTSRNGGHRAVAQAADYILRKLVK